MKKYELQKISHDDQHGNVWRGTGRFSNDLAALKMICPIGYRVIEISTNKVVYKP